MVRTEDLACTPGHGYWKRDTLTCLVHAYRQSAGVTGDISLLCESSEFAVEHVTQGLRYAPICDVAGAVRRLQPCRVRPYNALERGQEAMQWIHWLGVRLAF